MLFIQRGILSRQSQPAARSFLRMVHSSKAPSQPAAVASQSTNIVDLGSTDQARSWLEANLPKWSPESRRCGAVALKVGMVSFFDKWGLKQNCTVLQLDQVEVVQVKTKDKEGYVGLQVGAGEKKVKQVKMPQEGHFKKHEVGFKYKLAEFRVTEDALLPSGTRILAQHFMPGQFVDITGTSKGKGFQGVMKRHNFKGQRASHGVSKTHRHAGSTGQCQDPGKVFKGKKMAGHMGTETITTMNLQIVKIDPKRNLVYIRGAVPGNKGEYVKIKDAHRRKFDAAPPFPTYFQLEGEEISDELIMEFGAKDPFKHEDGA